MSNYSTIFTSTTASKGKDLLADDFEFDFEPEGKKEKPVRYNSHLELTEEAKELMKICPALQFGAGLPDFTSPNFIPSQCSYTCKLYDEMTAAEKAHLEARLYYKSRKVKVTEVKKSQLLKNS